MAFKNHSWNLDLKGIWNLWGFFPIIFLKVIWILLILQNCFFLIIFLEVDYVIRNIFVDYVATLIILSPSLLLFLVVPELIKIIPDHHHCMTSINFWLISKFYLQIICLEDDSWDFRDIYWSKFGELVSGYQLIQRVYQI